MNKQKKKQYVILGIFGMLVLVIVSLTAMKIVKYQKQTGDEKRIVFNQIYASDYNISFIDNNYFIGSYGDKEINVIIDKTGREVVKTKEDIYYDSIYKMKDGRYLIYANRNDVLEVYIFDNESLYLAFSLNNVSYAKPLIYRGDEYDYIIGFYNVFDNDLYIYKIDGKGVVIVKGVTVQAEEIKNGVYYVNNEEYLVVRNEDGLSGVIDYEGNVVIDYEYKDLICTKGNAFVALNNKGKYGIIDNKGDELVKFNYKVIKYYKDSYLIVNSINKLALYDSEFNNITGFVMDYDALINYDLRNMDALYYSKFNGNVLVANNYLEDTNGIEYTRHDLYIINNDKVWERIEQKGFFLDTLLFVYDSNYKVMMYDENYDVKGYIQLVDVSKIDNIRYVGDKLVVIDYFDMDKKMVTKYYDMEGNDVTSSYESLGKLSENNYLYHSFLKESEGVKSLLVYDYQHLLSNSIEGRTLLVQNEYLIVDKAIYRLEIMQ